MKIIKLSWSNPSPPTKEVNYNHCAASSPIGGYRIEWKSWKDYPGFSLYFNDNFVGTFQGLEESKNQAQIVFENLINQCLDKE